MLALCIASYSDETGSPGAIEAAVEAFVPKIGQIGDVPGKWTLDWGPAVTTNLLSWKANLLFAASYRDPASNLPIFSAVVIRGTDTSAGFLGVLTQMKEDLEAPPLLDVFKFEVRGLQYAHEGGTANRQLNGACGPVSGKFPWGAQLEYQHFIPHGYWGLMVNQYSSVLGALAQPSAH